MTEISYTPPERMFEDTVSAFRDMQLASTWRALIEPDPLGPVNKIVTLMRGNRRVKSVLTRVPVGSSVRLVHDNGGYGLTELFALREASWRTGEPAVMPERRAPGWYVEVGDRVVLYASEAETRAPIAPKRPVPWHRRVLGATRAYLSGTPDRLAGRFGYVRADDDGQDW